MMKRPAIMVAVLAVLLIPRPASLLETEVRHGESPKWPGPTSGRYAVTVVGYYTDRPDVARAGVPRSSGETRTRRSAAPRCSPCAPHFWTGSSRSGCDRAGCVRTEFTRSSAVPFDEGLAGDLLHDWDGALADERDGPCVRAHAVARDAAGRVGGPYDWRP